MPFPGIFLLIGMFGFIYMILAFQLSSSFPPFYAEVNAEGDIKLDLPYILAVFLALGVACVFFFPYLFGIFALACGWVGIRIRRRVQKRTNGPLPWLLNPLTIGVMNRWPMLLFDAWTIGFAALVFLVMLYGL
ncbi:hypothetical protein [Rhodovulum viride]|uniref:hypothetical protein n=1 Tax=Rhodovulum viride TaxID=1231134 RepID=UPI0011BF8AE5|nr:hypothetical protein [Rhodovulum viride]